MRKDLSHLICQVIVKAEEGKGKPLLTVALKTLLGHCEIMVFYTHNGILHTVKACPLKGSWQSCLLGTKINAQLY